MLLEKDSSVSIYNRNIPCLASEMYKVSNGLSPPVVSNILTQKNCYSNKDILPDSYKNLSKFSIFKNRIKKRKSENCPCRLSKTYIFRVGFTQAFAPVSWIKLRCFSHSYLYKRELVFNFLIFMFIIKFIALQFYFRQLTSTSIVTV